MSSEVTPRWEWRTFGESFGDAEARLSELPPELEESDDLYLLSVASNSSVKIRGGRMDMKQFQRMNEDALEQWKPVVKEAFPLPSADVETVLRDLGAYLELERDEYSLDQLLGELVDPSPELLAIEVHKRRRRVTVGGAMAELSDFSTDRGALRTIAVESEDPALVTAAVRGLGFDPHHNVCVPRGLKTLIRFGRFAVIDVGTNSVKFVIGELDKDGDWRTVVDRADVTRLGEGLDRTGELNEEPIRRTAEAIADMAEEAERYAVASVAAVGTAGVRMARNGEAFVEAVRKRTGIEVEIISGDEEGRLAYVAATKGLQLGDGSLVVFDTGGGSSQFTFGHGREVEERFSVNVGAVRFTERFGLDGVVPAERLAEALNAIAIDLERLDGRPTPDVFVGIGGAVTNLAAVKHGLATYDPDVVRGTVLDRSEINRQIELYRTRTADQRREIVGLQPKRAEVILAGACIVRTLLEKLGSESLTVSDRGLRHGLLEERFGRG
jgi:exopolyphosphatase/guanosine-5'-triphosphate,3'-diphosphate pyrophosphatase